MNIALHGNAVLQQLQLSSFQGSCISLPPWQKPESPHKTQGQQWKPLYRGISLLFIFKGCRNNRPGICASFPLCNRGHWSACAHRVVCDYSKALQVITQTWKLPINSLQLLCPLLLVATKSGKWVGCWAEECRTLRCEEGYAISSIFPLLSSRYNSPESQHIKK